MDLINEGTVLCLLILHSHSFSISVSQQGGSLLLDVVNLNRSLVESFVGNYGAYCWEVVNMGFV